MQSQNLDYPFGYELDKIDRGIVDYNARTKGVHEAIQEYLAELDVEHNPMIQTIHFRYQFLMAACLRLGYPLEKLKVIHQKNLEYEEKIPPIVYSFDKSKKTVKTVKTVVKRKTSEASPIKERKPKLSSKVRLVSLLTGKALIVTRTLANSLVQSSPDTYKIEEI